MQDLTHWRMTLARDYLRTGELALAPDRQPDRLRLTERLRRGVPPTPRTASRPTSWPDRLSPFTAGKARRWTAISS